MKVARNICMLIAFMLLLLPHSVTASTNPLRRPISVEQPMWIIHIDTWNHADPQKIIDMVPEDIKPWVVFNISLSINHRGNKWLQVEYGYETAKSWLRTCAENRVWAMVQPSSGAFCHFPDDDMTIYEEFFRDYPNFLGFNYCEQFWGYDDPFGVSYPTRLNLWAQLMKLNIKYGGYLCWSSCNAYYDADRNAVAFFKRNAELCKLCSEHPENLIMCEKFTIGSGFHDVQSTSLGAFLSGYAGHLGMRPDETGWVGVSRREKFPAAAGIAPDLERLLLTGTTVIDGPETVPVQVCHEIGTTTTPDGYTSRQWEFYPQFYNISIDMFRKIIDGMLRLPTRQEVVGNTKILLIQDVNNESEERDVMRGNYITPETLYDGLYKMPGDGTYLRQSSWFKSTGRYAAIPMIYGFNDDVARKVDVHVNVSDYTKRWPTEQEKVNEFNSLYPQEYTGDMYVGRNQNCWVVYNPFKNGRMATAHVPFKYNSCNAIDLKFTRYSAALIKELKDGLEIYINNYDNALPGLRTDTIVISGVKGKADLKATDRLQVRASTDEGARVWAIQTGSDYTVFVSHNGPVDIEIQCKGSTKNRLKGNIAAKISAPVAPPVYYGPRQYEAENFDHRGIDGVTINGVRDKIRNYTAQGYLHFGKEGDAKVRDMVKALKSGQYRLTLRYAATDGGRKLDLTVNGQTTEISLPATNTNDFWGTVSQTISLKKGENELVLSNHEASAYDLYLDNIVIE